MRQTARKSKVVSEHELLAGWSVLFRLKNAHKIAVSEGANRPAMSFCDYHDYLQIFLDQK